MSKKPIFDLSAGMQQELHKIASGDPPDLIKAGECLHAALEILEDEGLQRHANKVLSVLHKIAAGTKIKPVQKFPSMEELKQMGLTDRDLQNFGQGQAHAKVKMNSALRRMGMSDQEIANFIGHHNLMSAEDIASYVRLLDMIRNPNKPSADSTPVPSGEELTFKSLLAARAPGRPDKIPDVHTKGLTPTKEVSNIEHHGTPFNMPDLGWSDNLDPDVAEAFDAQNIEDLEMTDILDADITEDVLEVSENETLEDFEDEVSH